MAFSARIRKILVTFLILGWTGTALYFLYHSGAASSWLKTSRLYRDNRVLMGTFWEVTSPDPRAAKIVFAEASRIEKLLSKYLPDSEISSLNRQGKLKVSPETFLLIKRSLDFYRLTDGAFDISVAPLSDIWGFTNQEFKVPGAENIQAALKIVGSDKIILHENENLVEFLLPGMKIDLGGIAKGYALDRAVEMLKAQNIKNCLINAGGQVYGLGSKSGGNWKIAIRTAQPREISGVIQLRDQSASTSGNYEQFFMHNGKRYCHILDPRTGYPADTQLNSVTVISNSALEADVLSTAVFVLGRSAVEKLLKVFPKVKIIVY